MTEAVRRRVGELAAAGDLPAYLIDLDHLDLRLGGIRAALPPAVQLYYAAKANPAAEVLAAVSRHVDGFEVASGGELAHVRAAMPGRPLAFGGPGKTGAELAAAVTAGALLHVESVHELRRLATEADRQGVDVDVLLRVNPPITVPAGAAEPTLRMGGLPSPFGLDPEQADQCVPILRAARRLRFRGLHAHLASGLDAAPHLALSAGVLHWATCWARRHGLEPATITLGGGMAVDYADPENRFGWKAFGNGLAELGESCTGIVMRIEPGRAVTAEAGWYAAEVTDVRGSHGEWFAVLAGGTHHLRTPAARGHDQPFDVVPRESWPDQWPRPSLAGDRVTLVGALCTPRDVLARDRPLTALRAGDVVVFSMAGAYGWNISHHDFLMHPPPSFHYLPGK